MGVLYIWRSLGMAGRVVAIGVAGAIVVVAIWAVLRAVDAPRRAREAEVAQRTQTAYAASARAAIDIITAANQRDDSKREEIVNEVHRIQKLPEEQRYAASVSLLCGLREYSSDPRCSAMQQAGSR